MKTKNEVNNYEPNVVSEVTPKEKKTLNKKHKIIIAVCSVFLAIFLIIGIWFIVERNVNKWELKHNEVTIEYGEIYEPTIADLVDVEKYSNVKNSNTSIQINNASYVINSKNHNTPIYYDVGDYDIDVVHKVEYKLFGATIFTMDETKKVSLIVKDTVAPVFVEEEGINPKEIEFVKDCKEDITSKYKATDLSEVSITVDDTNVNYLEVGEYTANVLATDTSGNVTPYEIKVKVIEPSITLDKTSLEMKIGDTDTITATVKGKSQDIEWSSSDESVTKVENGNITANKAGKATIKAKANGVEATSEVTIKEKVVASSNNGSSKNNNNSSSTNNNNGGSSRPSPNGSTGNSGNNSSSTTTTKPVWCWEGGSKHVTPVGIGWYSSYPKARDAALKYLSEHKEYTNWEVQDCDCGKYTAYVR